MPRTAHRRSDGQSLVTLAVFAFLLFLTMGLAIDGGLIYTQRRVMQNTADAACLTAANRMAMGKTNLEATTAAQDIIKDNLGATPGTGANAPGTLAYSSYTDLYGNGTNTGTGASLVKGIEINGPDVRVALQSPANTTFMRIAGIATYTVAARAHCNATAGAGAVPFAVARWRGYDSSGKLDTDGLSTDKSLPQNGKKGQMTVHDILRREGSNIITQWPGWGSATYPGDPAASTDLYSSPSSTEIATDANPGEETMLAGNEARPNLGGNSFTGPIVLDYRQTTYAQPLFYNGLTPDSALPIYKDYATKYILGDYPGPSVIPGQELAYYSGVSAGLMEKPFNERYHVGDKVTMLIYNGTVYDSNKDADAFTLSYNDFKNDAVQKLGSGSGPSGYTCPSLPSGYSYYDTSKPAAYKFVNTPLTFANFELRAFLSNDPSSWGELEGTWSSSSPSYSSGPYALNINGSASSVSLDTSAHTINFKVAPQSKITCTDTLNPLLTKDVLIRPDGAETIYLESQNTAHSKRHGLYAFMNNNADSNDFYAYFPQLDIAYQPLEPGDKASVDFNADKANGTNGGPGTKMTLAGSGPGVDAISWYSPSDLSSALCSSTGNTSTCNGVTVKLAKSGAKNQLDIEVASSASTGKEYYLRFTLSSGSYTHYAWYYIAVRPPLNNSKSLTEYVYALGYTKFLITYTDSNTIKGRAISGLLDPKKDAPGLRPRLVGWE
jgi:Flp pilus assembly protein TadG